MRLCILGWGLFAAALAAAQTAESLPFRAVLLPRNEVPAITNLAATGTATLWVHVVRDAQGAITSAALDFRVRYAFPQDVTLTGLHLHQGGPAVNGPVVIDSGLAATPGVRSGVVTRQAQSAAPNVLRALVQNPAAFYVNLHTSDHPNGALRGQLLPAERFVFLTRLDPLDGVPASGLAAITITGARDRLGRMLSAELTFDLTQTGLSPATEFTALHIHAGAAGVTGPAVVNAGLTPSAGTPNLRFTVDAPALQAAGIFNDATQFYVDLHTAAQPRGALRGQLARADAVRFPLLLGGVPSAFNAWMLRDETGTAFSGFGEWNLNHRFPGDTSFSAPLLLDPTGARLDSGLGPLRSATGRGNLTATAFLPGIDAILKQPDAHLVELHGLRAPLRPLSTAAPEITATFAGVWDPSVANVARGGLLTVYGRNIAKTSGGTTGLIASRLPYTLNGTAVTVAGRPAPVLQINTDALIAQVPIDVPLGPQPVVITTPQGTARGTTTVAAAAPAVFFDDITRDGRRAAAFRLVNGIYSQITATNPARPGDILIFYGSGFGITGVPPVPTGQIPLAASLAPRPVVTIGGRNAPVLHSLVPPGLPGLNQVAVTMPNGAGAGPVPVLFRIGNVTANRVYLDAAMR